MIRNKTPQEISLKISMELNNKVVCKSINDWVVYIKQHMD